VQDGSCIHNHRLDVWGTALQTATMVALQTATMRYCALPCYGDHALPRCRQQPWLRHRQRPCAVVHYHAMAIMHYHAADSGHGCVTGNDHALFCRSQYRTALSKGEQREMSTSCIAAKRRCLPMLRGWLCIAIATHIAKLLDSFQIEWLMYERHPLLVAAVQLMNLPSLHLHFT